ncbi:MAG: hypothetical protein PHR35_05165, partial [Kiritimatiellae bacterium]|nr:hypothetical protein [Kiritimatiellia bacterium]
MDHHYRGRIQVSRGLATVFAVTVMATVATPCSWALVLKPGDPGQTPEITYRYPVVTVPRADVPPAIDGVVGKEEWSRAAQTLPFTAMHSGRLGRDRSVCWFVYSTNALYVAFRFERPAYAGEPQTAGGPDAVWGDDALELFLRPEFGAKWEYNFVLNAKGVRADGRRSGGTFKGWNAEWRGAARQGEHGYEGELMIPFASLGQMSPAPGTAWEFLAVNVRQTPDVEIGCSSHLRHWNATEDFGYLVFGDAATPAIRPVAGPSLSPGEAGIVIEAAGSAANALAVMARLYRSRDPGANYYDTMIANANPLGKQAEGLDREFVPAARVVEETLKDYLTANAWSVTNTLAADRLMRWPFVAAVPVGDYVLHYRVADAATGRLLAGGTTPFRQTPAFVVETTPYLLVARVLEVVCDYSRVEGVVAGAQVTAELVNPTDGRT